jgi:hypothetical protein
MVAFTGKLDFCHSGNVAQGGFVTTWLDSAMAHATVLATATSTVKLVPVDRSQ